MASQILLNFANICRDAVDISNKLELNMPKPDSIILTGMGGSGISGNLVKDITQDIVDVPIQILRGYSLPKYVNERTLVFCTSYSGNTEETLSQFLEAYKRGCKIISIASGGKLLEWSKKFNIHYIQVPGGYMPREVIPYLFFPIIISMQKIFNLDFSKDIEELLELVPKIDLSKMDEIAEAAQDTMPVICGDSNFFGVLRRIKSQLNENSKMTARFEELPELNHNEIVGYEVFKVPNTSMIFVRDTNEPPEMKRRIELTKEIIDGKVDGFHDIWSYGNSKLCKAMSLVYQGDYLSFKLAELRNVDWKTMTTIDRIKEGLKELKVVERLENEVNSLSDGRRING